MKLHFGRQDYCCSCFEVWWLSELFVNRKAAIALGSPCAFLREDKLREFWEGTWGSFLEPFEVPFAAAEQSHSHQDEHQRWGMHQSQLGRRAVQIR